MRIDLAGFGPGSVNLCTAEVLKAIEEADLIITSEGIADSLGREISLKEEAGILTATGSSVICRILEEKAYNRAVCLFRGDSSFYSGASPLLKLIRESDILNDGRHLQPVMCLRAPRIICPGACRVLGARQRMRSCKGGNGRKEKPVSDIRQ